MATWPSVQAVKFENIEVLLWYPEHSERWAMIGINLVITELELKGSLANRGQHEATTLCIMLGNLQPQILSLSLGNGCFSLCNEAVGKADLLGDSSLPISVLTLGGPGLGHTQNVLCIGNVDRLELPVSSVDKHLYPPREFLQLPMLLLSHTTLHVPLMQARGVASSAGYLTLAIAVFDMTKRAIDCLVVYPTGRIALRREHARELQRLAERRLPEGIVPTQRDINPFGRDNEVDCNGDGVSGDDDEEGRGEAVDDLLHSLDGILTGRGSRARLGGSSIEAANALGDSLQLSGILRPAREVSDSTLSLDDILAEMAEREQQSKAFEAEAARQRVEREREEAKVGKGEKNQPQLKQRPPKSFFTKKIQAVLSTQPIKAPWLRPQPKASPDTKARPKLSPEIKAKAKRPPPPGNVSRVMVLVRKEELALADLTDAASEQPASSQPPPAAPPAQKDPPPFIFTQLDAATERRVLERQIRMSQAYPVVPPLPPSMVYHARASQTNPSGSPKAAGKGKKKMVPAKHVKGEKP